MRNHEEFKDVLPADAACKLLTQLKAILNISDADDNLLVEQLQSVYNKYGYHALFGKTQTMSHQQ